MATEVPALHDGKGQDPVLVSLDLIHEQGRQTLELLKSLVLLLTPREGAREGPTLEELLSKLVTQQQQLLTLGHETLTEVQQLGHSLTERDGEPGNSHRPLSS